VWIATADELAQLVRDYESFDEFVFDVETMGPDPADRDKLRADPHRNEIFWISMAGPGRADVIPCGHPIGEKVTYPEGHEEHRVTKTGRYEEHRINPETGRLKWFPMPQQFTPAPKQLWISEVTEALRPLMFSDRRKIGHNVHFDLESIAKYYGDSVPPPPYGDTLVISRLVDENRRHHDLKNLTKLEFGVEYDNRNIGRRAEVYPFSEVRRYSYLDAKYDWLLWRAQQEEMDYENVRPIFDLEMGLLPAIIEMECSGVKLDIESLTALGKEFQEAMAETLIDIEMVNKGPINMNATRQVAHLVYDILGKECTVFTKSGERSVAADTLENFQRNKTVRNILRYQGYKKLNTAFVVSLQEKVDEGERIHPKFDQTGARGGRMSCREPNVQQVPSRSEEGKRIREMFVASPGHLLIVSDLSQIELRVLAHFTRDKGLLRAYREGLDLHAVTAERVFGKDFTAFDRMLGKNVNFCVPMDTLALTSTGWKSYDELQIGDLVLGRDGDVLHWTPVLEKMQFKDAELIAMSNNHFRSVSTPNHRWVGERRSERRPLGHYWEERQDLTTATIGSEDRIFLSFPLESEGELNISPDEAALIAWLLSDGHTVRGKFVGASSQGIGGWRVQFDARLHQSKPVGVEEIFLLLKRLGVDFRHRVRPTMKSVGGADLLPVQEWVIAPQFMRDLWKRGELDRRSLSEFVLGLSGEAIHAFVRAAWLAEGWLNGGVPILSQNEGPVLEAFRLAIFLSGKFPLQSSNGVYNDTENFNLLFGKPYVTGQRLKKHSVPNADVWCIRTELGSWVMRQDEQIMLTGNSIVYGVGPGTLVRKYQVPNLATAKRLLEGFDAAYPRVDFWRKETLSVARGRWRKGRSLPYVETILGRKRRLPGLRWADNRERSSAERQAISTVISGSAADLLKLATIEVYNRFQELDMGAHLLMSVHDELVAEVPEEAADDALGVIKDCMENVVHPVTGAPLISVPVIAEAKIVKRWSDAK
jgi:DNA polymerase I-like protein with 3'-5' exonuclease and polymerase domains